MSMPVPTEELALCRVRRLTIYSTANCRPSAFNNIPTCEQQTKHGEVGTKGPYRKGRVSSKRSHIHVGY